MSTDPSAYNFRDLLLLLQLLHEDGYINADSLEAQDPAIDELGQIWHNHISTKISREMYGLEIKEPLTSGEIYELYHNLLKSNELCTNTTDLANLYYFSQLEQLEKQLEGEKEEFRRILDE